MAQENSTVSAYAQYNQEHGVAPITAYLDQELVDMIAAAAKKANLSKKSFFENVLTAAVNKAGLTHVVDGKVVPHTYTIKTKTSEAERVKQELADALAELAALKASLTPTPPALKANVETGVLEEVKA